MKFATFGAFISAGLVVFAVQGPSSSGEVLAQRFAQRANTHEVGESSDLIVLSNDAADEQGKPARQVTVVDPKSRTMAVYHVKASTGEIELKSVRKFDWDLQMEEFNAASPLPREVRSQVTPNLQR
jgi:hypothetical protein